GGGAHLYAYDSPGSLPYDQEPDASYKLLSRAAAGNTYTVTVTTALSRTTTYRVENLPGGGGAQRRVRTDPSGARTESDTDAAGNQTMTYPDGSFSTVSLGPDPRWKMLAPIAT